MKMEQRIKLLEQRIDAIEKRNKRVEADKAWETSFTRKVIITLLTYFVIVLFLFMNHFPKPFINAIVPTIGFILSTLTLSIFKNIWLRFQK